METNVANIRVRACGTLGGNLCFAEPHSDPATLLTALGAKAHVQGKTGTRTVAIDKLITGAYETSLASDELLVGVEIPLLAKTQRAAYLKFQLKERPTLGLALVLDLDGDNDQESIRRGRQRQRRADSVRQGQWLTHRRESASGKATRRRRRSVGSGRRSGRRPRRQRRLQTSLDRRIPAAGVHESTVVSRPEPTNSPKPPSGQRLLYYHDNRYGGLFSHSSANCPGCCKSAKFF